MLLSGRAELYFKAQSVALIIIYLAYVMGGYKVFSLWSQIDRLAGPNPLHYIETQHGLRYLLAWPALFVSESFDFNRDTVFGLFVLVNLSLCVLFTARIQAVLSHVIENRTAIWLYFYTPVFIILSIPMNGRLSYMLVGVALMMFTYMRWTLLIVHGFPLWRVALYMLLCTISLVLLSVSSGCFTIGVLTALAQSLVFISLPVKFRHKLFHTVCNLVPPLLLFYFQYHFIEKNLAYYDGSILAMTSHGPGKFLIQLNPNKYLVAAILSAVVCLLFLFMPRVLDFIRKHALLVNPLMLILFSAAVGIFGYSALVTGSLPALILLVYIAGAWLYHGTPPIRKMLSALRQHSGLVRVSPACRIMAFLGAGITGVAGILFLPADWSKYTLLNVEQELRSSIVYFGDKPYHSYITGEFFPQKMLLDRSNNIYLVDNKSRILRIAPDHTIEVFAGDMKTGDITGHRLEARFKSIADIALDQEGQLYIADEGNNKVKKIDRKGMVTTIAGNGMIGLFVDGCMALECRLNRPRSIQLIQNNEILVSASAYVIRLASDGTMRLLVRIMTALGRSGQPALTDTTAAQ